MTAMKTTEARARRMKEGTDRRRKEIPSPPLVSLDVLSSVLSLSFLGLSFTLFRLFLYLLLFSFFSLFSHIYRKNFREMPKIMTRYQKIIEYLDSVKNMCILLKFCILYFGNIDHKILYQLKLTIKLNVLFIFVCKELLSLISL